MSKTAEIHVDTTLSIRGHFTPHRDATLLNPSEGGWDEIEYSLFRSDWISVPTNSWMGRSLIEKLEENRMERAP